MSVGQMEGDGQQDPQGPAEAVENGEVECDALLFTNPSQAGGMFDERNRADSLMLCRVKYAMNFVQMCEHKEGLRFADMGGDREESAYQGLSVELRQTENDALRFLSQYFKGYVKPDYAN